MKTVQPFIDLGFHTVPLRGKLERLEDGSKTVPGYDKDWKNKYAAQFNVQATKLGGALTGKLSGFIAIDCDSSATYALFKALDTVNKFHFVSKGKPAGGGTILYKYPKDLELANFSIQNKIMKLDFYTDHGYIYLPSDANETKEPWDFETLQELPPLVELPEEVSLLLLSLQTQYQLSNNPHTSNEPPKVYQLANYLAPSVQLMLDKDEFSPTLFRIITPKDFRTLPEYVSDGYIHPKDIPQGRGSEYLSKVSAILGKDSSITKDMYDKALQFINNLWDTPMAQRQLIATIISPMITGKATINGEVIWQYDDKWDSKGFSFINKLGEAVEVFFDDIRAQYHLVNFTRNSVSTYFRDSDIFSYIETVGLGLPARKYFKDMMPLIRTINDPSKSFGFFAIDDYTRSFNTFNQTPELAILTNPEPYRNSYKKPEITLKFLSSLIPNNGTRRYLLEFLRKKFTTFGYTPTVLYFLGAHGSGKDTFVNLLGKIIGDGYIARPTTKEFLEQYNGWLVDKYFVQLDEYGNQLTRFQDKQEALGKIKAYSGKETVQIRQMRTDGFNYKHRATFVMTANTNPLLLEQGDRRALIIETPNNLANEDWVANIGGLRTMHLALESEVKDFCFYLATEVEDMSYDRYVSPPYSKAKHTIIANSLPAGARLAYYFQNGLLELVEKLAISYEIPGLFDSAPEQRMYEDKLFELYLAMTDDAGNKRGLNLAMTDANFDKIPTTKNKVKAHYYRIPLLKHFTPQEEAFTEITEPNL